MIDVEADLCCTFAKTCQPGFMIDVFVQALQLVIPNLFHPCPYFGPHALHDVDMNEIVSRMLPQVVPDGTYKVFVTFHTKANNTIFHVVVEAQIKAKDFMKTMLMG